MVKNCAFVFIKPHAVTDACKELVTKTFAEKAITITKEGAIEAKDIDEKMLIDNHYYAIAAKATILTPDKIEVPKEKFKDKFGVEYDDCVKDGTALNAKQCADKFEVNAAELEALWAKCKKAGDLIKFGGGFYCAKLTSPKGEGPFYVFNGFFMSMRDKYVAEGVSLYYYVVEWESDACSWIDFRSKVLGATDPTEAPAGSLRNTIFKDWKALGLKAEPDTGDNGLHASASPFEALSERMNWLGYRAERDSFGKLLLKAGVTRKQIKDWCKDPQVTFGPIAITQGLFDSLEDTDSDHCLALCQMFGGHCEAQESNGDLEKEIARLKAQIEQYKPLADAVHCVKTYKGYKLPKAEPKKTKEEPAPREEPRSGRSGRSRGGRGRDRERNRDASGDRDRGGYKGYYDDEPRKGKGKGKYDDEPPSRSRGGRDKGKGKGAYDDEPRRGKGGGGRDKGWSRGRDDRDDYYYNDPPPLRGGGKGKGGGGGGGGGGKGSGGGGGGGSGKGKGGKGKGKY